MKLEYLQEFLAVVHYRSITKAAESLYISQPSLSRHLSELENELGGVELIVRGNSRVFTLTRAGDLLFQEGERLLQQIGIVERRVCREGSGYVGSLMVNSGMIYSPELIALFHGFAQVRKDINFQYCDIESTPTISNALDGRCDVCVAYTHELGNRSIELDSLPLQADRFVALVSDLNPLSNQDCVTIAELSQYPMLTVRSPEIGFMDGSRLSQILGPFLNNSITSLSFAAMVLQTRIDRGFCILPYTSAVTNQAGCHLLDIVGVDTATQVILAYRKDLKNPCLGPFLDYARQFIAGSGQTASH